MNRRQFLQTAGVMATLATSARKALGAPVGFPAGIQLYAVREPLAAQGAGTLKALYAIGFREVETYDMDFFPRRG